MGKLFQYLFANRLSRGDYLCLSAPSATKPCVFALSKTYGTLPVTLCVHFFSPCLRLYPTRGQVAGMQYSLTAPNCKPAEANVCNGGMIERECWLRAFSRQCGIVSLWTPGIRGVEVEAYEVGWKLIMTGYFHYLGG